MNTHDFTGTFTDSYSVRIKKDLVEIISPSAVSRLESDVIQYEVAENSDQETQNTDYIFRGSNGATMTIRYFVPIESADRIRYGTRTYLELSYGGISSKIDIAPMLTTLIPLIVNGEYETVKAHRAHVYSKVLDI